MKEKIRLGVIYGGKSSEHEVSLSTALAILKAVDCSKYEIIPYYIQLNGTWVKGEVPEGELQSVEQLRWEGTYENQPNVLQLKNEIDIAFPVIHGPNGEDGTLQGLLEMADIPYVGSGVLGSALGMDKVAMKNVFGEVGIPQCQYLSFLRTGIVNDLQGTVSKIEETLGYPCFVKPANMGSSVGISKAKDRESLIKALQLAAEFDRKVIVEETVIGRELEIGVLGNESLKTSVVGEIVPVNEFYDYEAKYKSDGTKLHIPAEVPASVVKQIEETAKKAFHSLDCFGLSRVDFFWDDKNDKVLINEINTMPGFTPFSMYPLLFKAAGISYPQLIDELVQLGLERFQDRLKNAVAAERLE